jgi:hypothetical protein
MLISALKENFNLDTSFSTFFTYAGMYTGSNGSFTAPQIQLSDLNVHDGIEHDASLTRIDVSEGSGHQRLDTALFNAMLADSPTAYLDAASLAKTRARLEIAYKARTGHELAWKGSFISYGEVALMLMVFGKPVPNGKSEPKDWKIEKPDMEILFKEERLPDGYVKPVAPISIVRGYNVAQMLQGMADKIKAGKPI